MYSNTSIMKTCVFQKMSIIEWHNETSPDESYFYLTLGYLLWGKLYKIYNDRNV